MKISKFLSEIDKEIDRTKECKGFNYGFVYSKNLKNKKIRKLLKIKSLLNDVIEIEEEMVGDFLNGYVGNVLVREE